MREHKSHTGNVSGHALLVVALALLGLAGTLALVLDGGSIYVQRRRVQAAADGGALAGAMLLSTDGTADQVRAVVEEYAAQYTHIDCSQMHVDSTSVTVVAQQRSPTSFARMVGIEAVTVTARAVARFSSVGSQEGLAPIAIRDFDYTYGVLYTIWDEQVDPSLGPTSGSISGSYRGWLSLPCVYPASCSDAGGEDLAAWMSSGYPRSVHINTWIRGNNDSHPATMALIQAGQMLKVAVYDDVQIKYASQAYYHIRKFAAFKVGQVYSAGERRGIQGTFERILVPSTPDGSADGGVRTIQLTR
jgi:Tfp pilus assembly protein PilV